MLTPLHAVVLRSRSWQERSKASPALLCPLAASSGPPSGVVHGGNSYLFCGLVVKGNLDGDARAGQYVQQLAVMSLHTYRHTSDSSSANCSCRLLNVPGLEGPAGLEERTLACLHLCQPLYTQAWQPKTLMHPLCGQAQ